MKIAVIWSRFGPYHLARLRGAAECGHACGAAIVGMEVAGNDSQYEWDVRLGAEAFERRTIFADSNYHDLSAKRIARGVTAALDEIRPDVVAVNGWSVPEARSAIDWCRARSGARAVLMAETKEDDAVRVWWKEAVKARIVNRCDAALVGGKMPKDYLVKLGFPRSQIFIGYDVVDNAYFAGNAAKTRRLAPTHRAELGLPREYFFACTRFLKRKNIDGLLKAYARYRAAVREDPWGLVIAGGGEEEPSLRKLEHALALEGVLWPGFVQYDRLPLYYGLASAFIHPAKAEAWGLVVNEAAASALPLLVSRTVGAAHELVADGENGLLFDPYDVEDMARVLAEASRAPAERRAQMGSAAAERASHWTTARFGGELLAAAQAATELLAA